MAVGAGLAGLVLGGLCVSAPAAHAATAFTWTGGGASGNWSDGNNWSGATAPSGAVDLIFPGSTSHQTMVDDISGLTVNSLAFQANGYSLSGNSMSPASITTSTGVSVTISNGLALSSSDLTITTGSSSVARLTGVLSGAWSVISFGSGTVDIAGSSANTNTGGLNADDTTVVELDKPAGVAATAGHLTAGNINWDSGAFKWMASNQINDPTREIDVAATGTLDLNGHNDTVGWVRFNSGTVKTEAGTLTVAGNISNDNTQGELDGNVTLTSAQQTIRVGAATTEANNVLTINATLRGNGPINKTGLGQLNLTGNACQYAGSLTVSLGTVVATNGFGGHVTQSGGTYQQGAACPQTHGYLLAAADGGVFAFGGAPFKGSLSGLRLAAPIVAIAATSDGQGYWLVGADGGVFALGDAHFEGSLAGLRLAAPIVGFAPTSTGLGYWLVGADGGVFALGDAHFKGSLAGLRLAAPIAGFAPTSTGLGYWLVGADGGVFALGDAHFYGSMGTKSLNAPVVGMTVNPDTGGYWLAGADGGVFSFNAPYYGSLSGRALYAPVVALAPST